ncbi:polysaccharide biosynthesis/export family protein [Mucilaginibacter koreensis]
MILVGVVMLSSCAVKQHQLLFQTQQPLADSAQVMPAAGIYRIKPYDILQLRNLQNMASISGESAAGAAASSQGQSYQVEDDGTVALPVIGHIKVAGLTRYEAEQQIEDLYRKKLLKDPIIELKITNLKVTLLGEVRSQGNFPLVKEQTTLIDMIGAAGGLTDKANEKNIKIVRGNKAHPQIIWADLSQVKTLGDPRLVLQNDDIVYVEQSKRAARSENLQYISTLVQPALLLLNTGLLIFSFSR